MTRNATGSAPDEALTPAQARALGALLGGATVTAAAAAAGVDRTTVHRWLRDDHAFIAAHNRGRRELVDEVRARLLAVAGRAAEAVAAAVEAGDARAALALLKGLGLLDGRPPAPGAEDPEVLREEARLARAEAERDLFFRGLRFG